MSKNPKMTKVLARFEPARRKSLRKLAVGTGMFVAPVVASFSMQGLGGTARAQSSNQTLPIFSNQPPVPTPALSPAGLVVTAGVVAGAAAVALRKRTRKK
jgi:hypothetical protein